MKRINLILSAVAMAALLSSCGNTNGNNGTSTESTSDSTAVVTAAAGSIVYFNLDKVMSNYDMAIELSGKIETKGKAIQSEITRRENKLTKDINTFQDKVNKGLLIRSVAEQEQLKLQQQSADFQNYVAQKQQELAEEQQVTLNQIADAIKTYVDKYNEEHQFALILSTQGDLLPNPVVCGDPNLDITQDIIDGLNAEYAAVKANSSK